MKKSIITFALLSFFIAFSVAVEAQTLTSKKGETILPEEGDYALGFDADPFLNYVGNFLNQANNNAPNPGFVTGSNLAITGKMFKDAQTAYRAKVRLGFGSATRTNMVPADDGNGDVEDQYKNSYSNIQLGVGMEKRRGNTRVQGFYGAEALIGVQSNSRTYTYGNDMTDGAITTTNFFSGTSGFTTARTSSAKTGVITGLTVRGFAGVEVFVFPKVSVAFEYGYGLRVASTGGGENETEYWDNTAVQTNTGTGLKIFTFGLDNDNNSGALTILFHF